MKGDKSTHVAVKLGLVMAGLVPAIHDLLFSEDVDARHKAGHDGWGLHASAAVAFFSLLLIGDAAFAADGDAAAGRRKALQCQTCHGLDGLSKLPEAPSLAGQPVPYLIKSLNDFRQGVRKNEMMSLVVQQLTDQDVADLAAYYAAITVTVQPPG